MSINTPWNEVKWNWPPWYNENIVESYIKYPLLYKRMWSIQTYHCLTVTCVFFIINQPLFINTDFQSKKTGGEAGNKEAEDAEMLLLHNKPLTDLTSLLTQLVGIH
jgi:hypothetical protein